MSEMIEREAGPFVALVNDAELKARVVDTRTNKTLKRYRGETAWSDAARDAEDRWTTERYAGPKTLNLRK